MTSVTASINGVLTQADVEARTTLGDFLRDSCGLTGTHLGCEHGVCGACTVLVDDATVRACLVYAVQVDGLAIRTIEGFEDDDVMKQLRAAFTQHHALQCGFCTPGMLIAGRDIVLRLGAADERRIREELAGNLCRCTGYVGIVRAIGQVAARFPDPAPPRRRPDRPAARPVPAASAASPAGAALKLPEPDAAATPAWLPKQGDISIAHRFVTGHDLDRVWALFADPKAVAACLPGAEVTAIAGDRLEGHVAVRMGPIRARFVGSATYVRDDAAKRGSLVGGGRDTLSNSRADGRLRVALTAPDAQTTQVDVELVFALQGVLAQFSRPAIVRDFTGFMIETFARNLSLALDGTPGVPTAKLGLGTMAWWWFKRLVGR